MLQKNTEWIVTSHNHHFTKLQPVGRALNMAAVPDWWIEYASANDLSLIL